MGLASRSSRGPAAVPAARMDAPGGAPPHARVAQRYGRWIYGATVLAAAGALAMSGAPGSAPLVGVVGAVFTGLGIGGGVVGALGLTIGVARARVPKSDRAAARSGPSE